MAASKLCLAHGMNELGAWLMLAGLHGPESAPTELVKGLLKARMLEYNVFPTPGLQSSLSPAVPADIRGHDRLQSKKSS